LQDFFMPIDSVAVFDHTVTGAVLDGVNCFVVCGHALSPQTYRELLQRVKAGSTCVISHRLYREHAGDLDPPDRWIVLDNFADGALAEALKPFLGPPDVARFRFANRTVEFRRGDGPNTITVSTVVDP
jgi:hypothetical protein